MSNLALHAEAARLAMRDAGIIPAEVDGLACAYEEPADLAAHLGIRPNWIDGTAVGGCSWIVHLRHAIAAVRSGLCSTVLIVHGESGRSRIAGPYYNFAPPGSIPQQFVNSYPVAGAATLFTLPFVRYMSKYGINEEHLANVVVSQRKWAMKNTRAMRRTPITVDEVLGAPMIAWPFRKPMCCLVADGGGAVVLTGSRRASDLTSSPVYVLGVGEAHGNYLFAPLADDDLIRPEIARRSAALAFSEASCSPSDIDHLMIYDAFAHNPIMGLEGLGFADYGEGAFLIAEGHTDEGGKLPMNTNGGGLSYAHTGSYGMLAMQESIRQLRGTAEAQVSDIETSLCHGWGGYFSACATAIFSNVVPQ